MWLHFQFCIEGAAVEISAILTGRGSARCFLILKLPMVLVDFKSLGNGKQNHLLVEITATIHVFLNTMPCLARISVRDIGRCYYPGGTEVRLKHAN